VDDRHYLYITDSHFGSKRFSIEKTLLPLDHELLHIHMAHLPRYYHKAAALVGVHQSYEPVLFFSILTSRWTGHHAGEDFVKFGDRSDKQVENSGYPSRYWRQGRTDCLELASPWKNSSKTGEFSGFFRNFCSLVFIVFSSFFCRRVSKFRPKKKNTRLSTPCLNLEHKCQKSTDRPYSPTT